MYSIPVLMNAGAIGTRQAYPSRTPAGIGALWTVTGAVPSTEYASRKVRMIISGAGDITAQAGSTYSINNGTPTADAGTITDGDLLRVFHTSSASYNDAVTGGVVIDTVSCDFVIETMLEPTAVAEVTFGGDSVTFDGDTEVSW